MRLNGTTPRHVIPTEMKWSGGIYPSGKFYLTQVINCYLGRFLHSADAAVGMTDFFHWLLQIQMYNDSGPPGPDGGRLPPLHRIRPLWYRLVETHLITCIPLIFCPILCYAVLGATSTPAGGSPRCYSGVYFYFAPVRYRKGVLLLVTWPNLIEFCSFLVALITLIIGIIDHKNKK